MRLWLAKVSRTGKVGLIPTDAEGADFLAKLGDGECIQFEPTRPRSVQWNRMYWGICREIGRNQDPQRTEDSIDAELRVRAGHFEVLLIGEHEVRVPRRIAFAKLTADDWAELWPSLELAGRQRFGEEFFEQVNVA